MIRLLLALCATVLFTVPAFTQQMQCTPIETVRAVAAQNGARIEFLSGDKLKRAAEIFNAFPPESSVEIVTAALVDLPNDDGGALAVGPAGMICGFVRLDTEQMRRLRNSLFGVGA